MQTILSIDLIATNPQVRSGRPCIAGTGLEVSVIVIASTVQKQTPEQIADDYAVSLAQVHAALAYYYEHQAEMDAQIAEQERRAQAYEEQGIGRRHKPLSG